MSASFEPLRDLPHRLAQGGELLEQVQRVVVELLEVRVRRDARQVVGDRADVAGDRHPVVVEDDQQVATRLPGVVQRLVGEAAGHRAVAQDGDDAVALPGEIAGGRHAERGGDARSRRARRRRRRTGSRPLEEAGDPAVLPDGPELVAPPGQHLVHVGLVAGVPHDPIARAGRGWSRGRRSARRRRGWRRGAPPSGRPRR